MATDETNRVIGGFRILKDLKAGAGSQGTVYQAVCEVSRFQTVAVGDTVALKVMAVQDDDGGAYARLEKRTAELVRLDHPNVVKYHGCFREPGPFNDVHVLVIEFVEGQSLKDLLAASPCGLGADEALRIAFGLIDGLDYTSSCGIVHRDIKPGNVIVRPDGKPKLIDFEVARREGGTATVGGGNMIGTFDYMAPDFTDAEFRGDVRSDIFSLGVVLHEMLTGNTPYRRHSGTSSQANIAFLQRWLKAGTMANPLRVSTRVGKLLPGARDVFERALAPDRERRLPDFAAFREALKNVRYRELAHGERQWRLLSYIGHGGFGEVFGAVDRRTGERVAVKHLLNASGLVRFRREANAMRRVGDSCFPRFVDWFTAEDGDAFLVMDYLDGMPGQSLKDVLKATPGRGLAREAVLKAFVRYARGLADLHALGLVHRDVKPANLYFPKALPDHAMIMDLGIARDMSGTATVGQVPGTIDYMPPECVTGKTRGGPEADVWALGLCLYEALSGRTAYPRLPDGQAAFEAYFRRVSKGEKPDFSGVDDKELRTLLVEMCAVDSEKRIRDVRLVERRLRIASGENPENLPVPSEDFAWKEASPDADFADGEEVESPSCATLATVWGGEDVLAKVRADYARGQRAKGRRTLWAWLVPIILLMLAVGGYFGWRYAERRREQALAQAAERARLADEAARREEEAHRVRMAEEQARQRKEAERQKAEAQKAEQARLAKEEAERKRQAEVAAEAARKVEEAARQAEAQRRAAAEAERKAQKEKADREAARKDEERRQALARQAEANRLAREEAERQAKAEAERLAKEEAERLAKEEAERQQEASRQAELARQEQERTAAEEAERAKESAEKERLAREVDEEVRRERAAKLKALDDAFAAYTLQYEKKKNAAMKPGAEIDPTKLQQEYLIKRRSYRAARKQLQEGDKKP